MEILILFNPVSGTGRAGDAAADLAHVLRQAGHVPHLAPTRLGADKSWLDELMGPVEVAVVVGGDGAVRMASGSAAATGTPICQWPSGTENLFAREFGFNRDTEQLVEALARFEVRHVDLGEVNGRPFVLMVSIGLDANIVQDLDTHRIGSISHLAYVRPMLRQLIRFKPPKMRIELDGSVLVEDIRGQVVVANSRHYAAHLDPAWKASVDDGLLDLVFMPDASRCGAVIRSIFYALKRHRRDRSVIYRRGREIRITCDSPQYFQLDGDPPRGATPDADRRVSQLLVRLSERCLPVLIPT